MGCVEVYRITGRKQFWLWLDGWRVGKIPLLIDKNSIVRLGKQGKPWIGIFRADIKRAKSGRIVLDATSDEQKGAIVFWDLAAHLVEDTDPQDKYCMNIYMIGYPRKIETENAEILLKEERRHSETLVCVVYPGGKIELTYLCDLLNDPTKPPPPYKPAVKACLKLENSEKIGLKLFVHFPLDE